MQGVLCLLYRKRECNLIVGSANRLFLRDKNAREKQRLAGNCWLALKSAEQQMIR